MKLFCKTLFILATTNACGGNNSMMPSDGGPDISKGDSQSMVRYVQSDNPDIALVQSMCERQIDCRVNSQTFDQCVSLYSTQLMEAPACGSAFRAMIRCQLNQTCQEISELRVSCVSAQDDFYDCWYPKQH